MLMTYQCDFYSENLGKKSDYKKNHHFSTSRVVRFVIFHFQAYSQKIRGAAHQMS